jgi:SAM-dependent methyltransferase
MTEAEELLRAENRRLTRELSEAQKRLRAIDASRWWRLHPRLLWRRVVRARSPAAQDTRPRRATPPASAERTQQPQLLDRFRSEVVERGTFSHDWFTGRTPVWEPLLAPLAGNDARVLEIGSFEGLSVCYFLWRLPDCTVTCVDTFDGGFDQHVTGIAVSGLEETFDANVALVDTARVRKVVGDSRRVLLDLALEQDRFDLAYVDGSHLALDVIVDAALSWHLLKTGGVLVFDDYVWTGLGDDPLLRPGPAIDAFLALIEGRYELVFSNYQVALRKSL